MNDLYNVNESIINNKVRYIIVDCDNNVIDNANGYGYTNKVNAYKAYAYKFGKSKKNIDYVKNSAIKFWKTHKNIEEDVIQMLLYALKDNNDDPYDEIIDIIKETYGITIKKQFLKYL